MRRGRYGSPCAARKSTALRTGGAAALRGGGREAATAPAAIAHGAAPPAAPGRATRTRYKGPGGIAEYRAIPHEDVGGRWFHDVDRTLNLNNPVLAARPARSQIYVETKRREEWRVYAGTDRQSVNATWKVQYDFYPCSMIKRADQGHWGNVG